MTETGKFGVIRKLYLFVVVFDMVNCWASKLNNCCDNFSREHTISASLFPKSKTIFVQGFHWCKNEQKEVSIAKLTSKILCKHHNNSLSQLDTAAGHAFNNFEYVSKLIEEANQNNGRFKVKNSHVNALLLERWLLKTLINVCYEQEFLIGNNNEIGMPDENLIKICFGKSTFSNGAGMYIAANMGDQMGFGRHINIIPIVEESENRVVGCMFSFAGLLIYLQLMPEKLLDNFDWIKQRKPEWLNVQPSRPFKKIKFNIPSGHSHTVHFHW